MSDADQPCTCIQSVALHSGHCCMAELPDDYGTDEVGPAPASTPHPDEDEVARLIEAMAGAGRRPLGKPPHYLTAQRTRCTIDP